MSKLNAALCAAVLAGVFAYAAGPAAAQTAPAAGTSRMKVCADEWNALKAAKKTAGKTYRDFSKECMARDGAATTAATTAAKPEAKPDAKPASAGRQAMLTRQRACGAEWKAAKAAKKVPQGMTWPKYWSECNTRLKAKGQ